MNLPILWMITRRNSSKYVDLSNYYTIELVNNLISTSSATFRGTYSSISELPSTGIDDNDYAWVLLSDSNIQTYDKYKYTDNGWLYEFTITNFNPLFDDTPTQDSNKLVNSGVVYNAINGKEDTSNKVTFLSESNTDELYPSAKAVYTELNNNYVNVNNAQEFSDTQKEQSRENIGALAESDKPIQYMAKLLVQLQQEVEGIKALLTNPFDYVNTAEYIKMGKPTVLYSSTASAPSSSNIPDNWDEDTMGVWSGYPFFEGLIYVDKASKKVYMACAVTASTNDWVVLN